MSSASSPVGPSRGDNAGQVVGVQASGDGGFQGEELGSIGSHAAGLGGKGASLPVEL